MKKFRNNLTLAAIAILAVISVVSIFYIYHFQSIRGLNFDLEAPTEVFSGEPFDLKINFSNNSGTVLKDARLSVALPDGAAFFGSDAKKTIDNKFLGNVGIGGLVQESYRLAVFSPEKSTKEFKATINYATQSLGARFEKSKTILVFVKSSGVNVEMTAPERVVSGDAFEIGVVYRNISDIDFSNLELKLEYPPSFSFASASLKPDSENNIWRLGDLRKNSEGKFTIKGSLIGSEGDTFEFKSNLSTGIAGQSYLVNSKTAPVTIASSPLSMAIHLNSDTEYFSKSGDTLNYTISYINNTDAALGDVVIRAQLLGEMYDISTIQTQGFFRSADNMLIWNPANTPALAVLNPGSAGVINFNIKTKDNYPIRRFSDKNFLLVVDIEIESGGKVISKKKLETKVLGNVVLDARAFFRDAESGILNKGSMPPKVGQPTNFTIHWVLKNSATDISNVEVRASLGNNVKIVGQPKSNVSSVPFMELATNEIVWRIDKVSANQGVVSNPLEAIFQIEAIPTSESIGNYMQLISQSNLRALDNFTNRELAGSDLPITTALPDDVTVGQQGGVIQP
ncbi:MAG: hypothetical protein HZB99_01120 [Candidatus Harrisonbacteria bacterium]|nr:hypothetical protein [Candidatus Harrisonbacteria bacterium]